MDWYLCSKTFINVVDLKSITETARRMYKTHSAISKRIAWLENQLDVKLLSRSTRNLELTEAGEKYYKRILPLLNEWEEVRLDVTESNNLATGVLRIATPTIAGNHYIAKYIDEFLELHPQLKVEFHMGIRINGLLDNKVDVYVGIAPHDMLDKISSEKLTLPPRKLFVSPTYLEKHGEPKSLDELVEHNCLVNISRPTNYWNFNNDRVAVTGNFTADNTETLIIAARCGVGIIYLPESFVQEEIYRNELINILPEYKSESLEIFVYYSKHDFVPMKIKVLIEYLHKIIQRDKPVRFDKEG